MSKWKKVKFLDYIELNPKVLINKGEICPFIEMANVDCNMRQPRSFEYKPFTSGVKFQTYDTVIARIEPCLQNGKGFLFTKQGVGFGSTEYLVFRAKPSKTIPLFVYYFMRTHKIKTLMCNSMSGATGRQRVNNDVFLNLEVDIPSYDEQQRIATILSRYDSLIENYQKQIKLLEESAQRLYKEWFVDLRFPGHENTKIVDGVPEGWEKKKVGDIVKIKSGFAFKSKDWQKQGCPVVKIKDISGVFVNTDSLDYVSSNVVLKAQQYLLNKMDLVIAMTGATIGKIGLITDNGLYANQRVGKFFLQNTIDVPYLYCFFKQAASIEQIVQISSASSAQPNISGGQLESLEILYNVNILKEFNLKCYKYFRQMIHLYSQIRHLTEARDRLLPKLMSGEIEV